MVGARGEERKLLFESLVIEQGGLRRQSVWAPRLWAQPHLTPRPTPTSHPAPRPALSCCSAPGPAPIAPEKLAEAVRIRDLLGQNTEELRSVARALNGEYILPEAGGDLLRDGAGEAGLSGEVAAPGKGRGLPEQSACLGAGRGRCLGAVRGDPLSQRSAALRLWGKAVYGVPGPVDISLPSCPGSPRHVPQPPPPPTQPRHPICHLQACCPPDATSTRWTPTACPP